MKTHFLWSASLFSFAGSFVASQQALAQQPHIILYSPLFPDENPVDAGI